MKWTGLCLGERNEPTLSFVAVSIPHVLHVGSVWETFGVVEDVRTRGLRNLSR